MYDVPHRHIVLSLPDKLWPVFTDRLDRIKVLMDAAILVLEDVMSHRARRRINPGAVVVIHPSGRDHGAYFRKLKAKYKRFLVQRSLRDANLEQFEPRRHNKRPVCGQKMLFLKYQKKKPPDELEFGERIDDWRYIVARPT